MNRLDEVDPEWGDDIQIMADGKMVVKLTLFGVTRCSTGEPDAPKGDGAKENAGTASEAQAFKRACAKFGLGRYLYFLPRQWVGYDNQTKKFNEGEIKPLPDWALPQEERHAS